MKKIYFMSFIILLICISLIIGFGLEYTHKISYNAGYEKAIQDISNHSKNIYFSNYSNYSELSRIKYYPTNYSETAYIKITPEKNSKFIYFECGNNSTLKILDNKIYCERGKQ